MTVKLLPEEHAEKGNKQTSQVSRVLTEHDKDRWIFTRLYAMPKTFLIPFLLHQLPKCNRPGGSIGEKSKTEHRVIPAYVFHFAGLGKTCNALVNGHARASTEEHNRDDEAPKVKLAAVTQWMFIIRSLLAALDAQ